MRPYIVLVLGLLFISVAPLTRADDVDDAIVKATVQYLTKGSRGTDIAVVVEKIVPGFARATATPVSGVITDPVDVYLKGKGQRWTVITFGTGLIDTDLKELGIPVSLAD